MRALIFAAGVTGASESEKTKRQSGDIVIAANGGVHYCLSLGMIPDVVIGDFDSISSDDLLRLSEPVTQLIRFPAKKDFTDLELALQHACSLSVDEILIFGGLGLRWDHTLANILLLASPALDCHNIRLIDGNQEIFLVSSTSPAHLHGNPGDTVSLIPIRSDATGINTTNLEYPLTNGTLVLGASRGVSNVMIKQTATVSITHGMVICVVIHQ